MYCPAEKSLPKGVICTLLMSLLGACTPMANENAPGVDMSTSNAYGDDLSSVVHTKPVVYQVFTRLYGNTNTTNRPWGTREENGVGKFNDFTDKALADIKKLGTSHIWFTGVPHHAVVADYSQFGISSDDPDVVKGRAGSPYAVKDYYNVDPDLAEDPANRLAEFEALISRTHAHGMKVIIDIVPNHVARQYESMNLPEGVANFGAQDNTNVEYARDNNFYYVVGKDFVVPQTGASTLPLGGEPHPLADGKFNESPAKWTGNGARTAQPDVNDWYETVKVNYGVKPDGSYDFPVLPDSYRTKDYAAHAEFWAKQSLPDSWYKFRNIAHFWLRKGVDGFRYDMAEMVPVEFWSFLNSSIKMENPSAFLLAEVYQPELYRDYIQLGKMDYLYDKVAFYDSLKAVMQNSGDTSALESVQEDMQDIESHMLHFLENHDEQRIASPQFAGNAVKGKPALVVSALISRSPMMLYFGQDVGEDGSEDMGFGDPSRTTIFDYAGVPAHQRWMNNGKFDGGQSTDKEKALRAYYEKVMGIAAFHKAMAGDYTSLHTTSLGNGSAYSEKQLAFARYKDNSRLIVISHFDSTSDTSISVTLPASLVTAWNLESSIMVKDLLTGQTNSLTVKDGKASLNVDLAPLESKVYELE
ncbi:alpha-amylase [Alteromonas pelagimontana]|uniref:Alpha-amylase n=2 Tax=Alteromonas pelagimontana TaxID=1858656 RepID=A0A6M4MHY6_9ALTE|nr:alpha-amylase [Alteromonas pelagimontana]